MNDTKATEHMTKRIFETIDIVLSEAQARGDTAVLSRLGPVLLSTGALVLTEGVGLERAAQAIRDLATRVERGDFSKSALLNPAESEDHESDLTEL